MTYYEEHAEYEIFSDIRVRQGVFIGIRLDGIAFHTFTKGLVKPFDRKLESAMDNACAELLSRMSDAYCAYVQSDEITLVLKQEADLYDRRLEKLLTMPASLASAVVSQEMGMAALFDARILVLPAIQDVQVMLHERQLDCRKNAVSTTLYWYLRQQRKMTPKAADKLMQPMSGDDRKAYLKNSGVGIQGGDMWGRYLTREAYEKIGYNPKLKREEIATRNRIIKRTAPDFWTHKDSEFLHILGVNSE